MYNLLVTAEEGAWDRFFYEFDRSRFLEYTNDNVAKAFKGLTEKRIATLKSFPCVFAYEGTGNNVRIGYLKSIKEQGSLLLKPMIELSDTQNGLRGAPSRVFSW